VEAAQIPWRPLGELFVVRGLISEEQLEEALAEQIATGRRLGEILVERKLISSPELTNALMEQLGREVARQEGFGSGLWAEIQRRRARPDARPELSLVVARRPSDPEPEDTVEGWGLREGTVAELELDIEELTTELGIAKPASSRPEEQLSGDLSSVELERLRRELQERSATVETLTSELEGARRSVEAREQTFAKEIDNWQRARREAERDLEAVRRELDVRAARVAELETTLAERNGRIEDLQSILADIGAERDASKETLARAEARAAEAEGKLRDSQALPAGELEQRLEVAEGRVVELEGQASALGAQIEAADASLAEEQDAHAQTRRHSEEAVAEAVRGREALREIELELEAARGERDAARSELQQAWAAAAELEQARADLDEARAAVLDLEQRLKTAAGRAIELDRQASELGGQLAALEAAPAAERQTLQEAEGRHEDARRERDAARAEVEQARTALGALERRVAGLGKQLTGRESRLVELEAELASLMLAREYDIDERMTALEETGRRHARELAQEAVALKTKEQELVAREQRLAAGAAPTEPPDLLAPPVSQPQSQAAPSPSPAPPPPEPGPRLQPIPVLERGATPEGGWNLDRLERWINERGDHFPGRVEEWRYYIVYMRNFTNVDSVLPSSFDGLVWDVFGDLLATATYTTGPHDLRPNRDRNSAERDGMKQGLPRLGEILHAFRTELGRVPLPRAALGR
jgi:chromosome segregation ATPase